MTYFPLAHFPRSITRQRSLQKGNSASVFNTIFLQVGQRRLATRFFGIAKHSAFSTQSSQRTPGYCTPSMNILIQQPASGGIRISEQKLKQSRYHIVVVRFGDLAAVELALADILAITEIVDIDHAINLRRVHGGPSLPQQIRLFRRTL